MTLDDRVTRLEVVNEELLRTLVRIEARLDRLDAKIDTRIDNLEAKLGARINQLDARINQVYAMLLGGVTVTVLTAIGIVATVLITR